jgi:hypothetical protein
MEYCRECYGHVVIQIGHSVSALVDDLSIFVDTQGATR